MNDPSSAWARLGAVPPAHLLAPRLVLHHAVQLLASFGQTLVEPRSDDSHRSMDWHEGDRAFLSQPTADGLRAAVRMAELGLELRRGDEVVAALNLAGATLGEARAWLGAAIGEAREAAAISMEWPEYEIPARIDPEGAELGETSPLVADPPALEELARWYQDAYAVLTPLAAATTEASHVRCWPHHFDMATLLTFTAGAEDAARAEGSRSREASGEDTAPADPRYVGIGLSPGDEGHAAPYFYVNGWPAPDPVDLPALDGPGGWHTEGWTGAVLSAEAVVAMGSADAQHSGVEAFLHDAVEAMKRAVLG